MRLVLKKILRIFLVNIQITIITIIKTQVTFFEAVVIVLFYKSLRLLYNEGGFQATSSIPRRLFNNLAAINIKSDSLFK
jgi:hypothetical protein